MALFVNYSTISWFESKTVLFTLLTASYDLCAINYGRRIMDFKEK